MFYNVPTYYLGQIFNPLLLSQLFSLDDLSHLSISPTNDNNYQSLAENSFYQQLFIEIEHKPISRHEVYEVFNHSDNDTPSLSLRDKHIYAIAQSIIHFFSNSYIQLLWDSQRETTQTLEITQLDQFYILAAIIFKHELFFDFALYDNKDLLPINISQINSFDLSNWINTTQDKINENQIYDVKLLDNNKGLNQIQDMKTSNWETDKFYWNETKNYHEDSFKNFITLVDYLWGNSLFFKVKIHNFDFCPVEKLLDKKSMSQLALKHKGYLKEYLDYINHHPATKDNNDLVIHAIDMFMDQPDNILEEQLIFLWRFRFAFNIKSSFSYRMSFNIYQLYDFNKKWLLEEFMNSYYEHCKLFHSEQGDREHYKFIQHEFFHFYENEQIIPHLDFENMEVVKNFIALEINNIQEQLSPSINFIINTYNNKVFKNIESINNFDSALLPTISLLPVSKEDKTLIYDRFLVDSITNKDLKFWGIFLKYIEDIPQSYFWDNDHYTQLRRQQIYFVSLLKATDQFLENFNSPYAYETLKVLYNRIPNIDNKEGFIHFFEQLLEGDILQLLYNDNEKLNFNHLNHIFRYNIVHHPEFLTDNDICKIFYTINENFFLIYDLAVQAKGIDPMELLVQFTDINAIKLISYGIASILNHPNCPPEWKRNSDIVISNGNLANIQFTQEELIYLFKDMDIGIQLLENNIGFYHQLPAYLKENSTYAETFVICSDSFSSIKSIPNVLWQYQEFCINISRHKPVFISFIPDKHWNDILFIQKFFDMIEEEKISLEELKARIPYRVSQALDTWNIEKDFFSSIKNYIQQQQLEDKIHVKLLQVDGKKIKKKKI